MRILVVLLCGAAVFAAGVSINHAYLASQYQDGAPERAFEMHTSAIQYGAGGIICLALALAIYVFANRKRQAT